jgi:adenylosuccinate synthase
LGLYGRGQDQLVDVVVGGQFGSEGKGHICSYLASEYEVLVRVGGPNAGHKVFQAPEPYTHRQLPSGTLFSNAKLLIGPGATIDVETLLREAADCDVDANRLSIDPQAMIITSADKEAESDLIKAIGSTGQGVGAASARRITDRVKHTYTLARDIAALSPFCRPIADELENAYARRKRILLEGTQGTGLSILHGSYPHVTSRDTTVAGCLSEAGIAPIRVRKVIMVCRSYVIRVKSPARSSSGPLKGEIDWSDISARAHLPLEELQGVELGSVSKKQRRVGEFDWALLRRASLLNTPTDIALTFADYIDRRNSDARRFEQLTGQTIRFAEEIEKVASAPVSLISTRFHWKSIIDRRAW